MSDHSEFFVQNHMTILNRNDRERMGDLVDQCREYLAELRIVLWSQAFDIQGGDLDAAAEWLASEIYAVGKRSGVYS